MVGDAMKVGAGVFLNDGFTAAGVRLLRADITGVLACGGAQLNRHDEAGVAMNATGSRVQPRQRGFTRWRRASGTKGDGQSK
jgi:hypothetical protein